MSKPPAFQLYASDFYMDVAGWSATQVGIYFRLLMYEWVNGSIPNDCKRMSRISGVDVGNFKKCYLQDIENKFTPNGDGNLINIRLEKTRNEQETYRKAQQESGLRGIEVKKEKGIFPFNKSSDPLNNPSTGNQALQSSSSTLNKKDKNIVKFDAEDFKRFYSAYPVHVGKTPALDKWKQKLKNRTLPELNILLEAIRNQTAWRENATEFRPAWKNPTAWLHQESWKDETSNYGGTNGTGKRYDKKDKSWVDRETDAEIERNNELWRKSRAAKAAARNAAQSADTDNGPTS